ncbi:hypothetical protein AVEN_145975-1 [Araneus ventricosus]|uniref:Uncharacterized protein n=1 Tax=Araneus ventricosus TaxID=182803 RepID=A0A4Y2TN13_ARAVE|nr:hypothetical protein AVEN_145975-1 [Araneus ventricosus]
MSRVYRANFMNDGLVREWCKRCKDDRIHIHGEDGKRRMSDVFEDLVQRVDQVVRGRDGCDFHLFRDLKTILGGQICTSEKLQNVRETYRNTTTFHEEGIGKLVHKYVKSLNLHAIKYKQSDFDCS